jgi:hypothetical protein
MPQAGSERKYSRPCSTARQNSSESPNHQPGSFPGGTGSQTGSRAIRRHRMDARNPIRSPQSLDLPARSSRSGRSRSTGCQPVPATPAPAARFAPGSSPCAGPSAREAAQSGRLSRAGFPGLRTGPLRSSRRTAVADPGKSLKRVCQRQSFRESGRPGRGASVRPSRPQKLRRRAARSCPPPGCRLGST